MLGKKFWKDTAHVKRDVEKDQRSRKKKKREAKIKKEEEKKTIWRRREYKEIHKRDDTST